VEQANKNTESIFQLSEQNASSSNDAKLKRFKRTTLKSSNVQSANTMLIDQMNKAAMNSHQSVKIQYRSCHEIFTAHTGGVLSSLANNRQVFNTFVDPDGLGIGDPPIFVECDMANNG
jgi:Tfp pilus assembly protein PilW